MMTRPPSSQRSRSSVILLALMGLLVGLSALACGDDTSEDTFSCCLNGAFYECSDDEEQASCNFDDFADQCDRAPSRDDECS